jgi:hypothetical protein
MTRELLAVPSELEIHSTSCEERGARGQAAQLDRKNRKALLDKIQQPTHEEAMQIAMAFIDGRAGTTARTTTWLA